MAKRFYGVFVPLSAGKGKFRRELARKARAAAHQHKLKMRDHTDPNSAAEVRDMVAAATGIECLEVAEHSYLF